VLVARDADGLSVAVRGLELYETTAATGLPPDVGVSVTLEVLIVVAFIGSLNVTTISASTATPVALFDGETLVTVGGVTSGGVPAVVKVLVSSGDTALPATSWAPEVTLMTWVVPAIIGEDTSNETLFEPWNLITPATGEPP
jgi:hypothetical protein